MFVCRGGGGGGTGELVGTGELIKNIGRKDLK